MKLIIKYRLYHAQRSAKFGRAIRSILLPLCEDLTVKMLFFAVSRKPDILIAEYRLRTDHVDNVVYEESRGRIWQRVGVPTLIEIISYHGVEMPVVHEPAFADAHKIDAVIPKLG